MFCIYFLVFEACVSMKLRYALFVSKTFADTSRTSKQPYIKIIIGMDHFISVIPPPICATKISHSDSNRQLDTNETTSGVRE